MNLLCFDSHAHWVGGVATCWRDRLRLNPALRHCLASGNTPIPIFRAMVDATRQGHVSFKQAVIFALDEFGGLAPDDPGACRNMLLRDLVHDSDLVRENFHCFNPAAPDFETECRAYDQAMDGRIDLVLLGIGGNGHLGMNEPGSAADSPTRRTGLHESTIASSARYLEHQRLPKWGLTVGMEQFFQAREVWLIATGQAKAAIVRRLVKEAVTEQVPASLMRSHPNCSLFVDAEAGSLL